jgi:hypothetical protein
MIQKHPSIGLIDPPSPWDTLQSWRDHLSDLEKMPPGDPVRTDLLKTARTIIRDKIARGEKDASESA